MDVSCCWCGQAVSCHSSTAMATSSSTRSSHRQWACQVAHASPTSGNLFQINHNFSAFRVHAHPFTQIQPIVCKGQGHKLLNLHGHVLSTVSLLGGACDIHHREIQITMVSDLNYNGIPAIAQPHNMVNSWMTPVAFDDMNHREGNWPLQGCILDILMTKPQPGSSALIQ